MRLYREDLATRANVGAAAGNLGLDDFGATLQTWLAFAAENLGEFFEIVAFCAIGLNIGSHRRAARFDRFGHNITGGAQ